MKGETATGQLTGVVSPFFVFIGLRCALQAQQFRPVLSENGRLLLCGQCHGIYRADKFLLALPRRIRGEKDLIRAMLAGQADEIRLPQIKLAPSIMFPPRMVFERDESVGCVQPHRSSGQVLFHGVPYVPAAHMSKNKFFHTLLLLYRGTKF